jgi:hypothetical protein
LAWRYRGVVHEFPHLDGEAQKGYFPGVQVESNRGGARSRDPQTYAKDAKLLKAALDLGEDPDLVDRYTFYLAQSYRDMRAPALAADWYRRRAEMPGGWQEERYVSYSESAQIAFNLGDTAEGLRLCAAALAINPARRETVHLAASRLRLLNRFEEAMAWIDANPPRPAPPNSLFLAQWIYDYGLIDEAAVCAFYCGRYADSLRYAIDANLGSISYDADRKRFAENVKWAYDALIGAGPVKP